MKRKLITIGIFALALMLLVCGCGSAEKEEITGDNGNVLVWDEITDIFDPRGYAAKGYFEMTQEELLEIRPDLSVTAMEWPKYFEPSAKQVLAWKSSWFDAVQQIEYSEWLQFENEKLNCVYYEFGFYNLEDGRKFFSDLCKRMQEITDDPFWLGIYATERVAIENIEEYLENEPDYGEELYPVPIYIIDLANVLGSGKFDRARLKTNPRWIEHLGEVKCIQIHYMNCNSEYGYYASGIEAYVMLRIYR